MEEETPWKQVNITYPGDHAHRERRAVTHLTQVLPAAEKNGTITAWWFIRKSQWRVRYLLANQASGAGRDPLHQMLSTETAFAWTRDIYEPEHCAFGGPESMALAHTLFHTDSRHLLHYLDGNPADRKEHSLLLCTALMRAAGLDWNEQGDVWARIAGQRAGLPGQAAKPGPRTRPSFTAGVRCLLLGTPRPGAVDHGWLTAFTEAGAALQMLRERGKLTRGIRAVTALHIIFHWNRIGIPGVEQAVLAKAAKDAVFAD